MSTIKLAIEYCKCHMIPADQCVDVNDMIQCGVPLSDLTYEVELPEEVKEDVGRMAI